MVDELTPNDVLRENRDKDRRFTAAIEAADSLLEGLS